MKLCINYHTGLKTYSTSDVHFYYFCSLQNHHSSFWIVIPHNVPLKCSVHRTVGHHSLICFILSFKISKEVGRNSLSSLCWHLESWCHISFEIFSSSLILLSLKMLEVQHRLHEAKRILIVIFWWLLNCWYLKVSK